MAEDGIFDIFTVADLFRKLQRDCQRVTTDPSDRWAAIDFVLTADSLRHWVAQDSSRQIIGSSAAVQICRELANRAKHWRTRPRQVKDSKAADCAFQFDAFAPGFQRGDLVVVLGDDAEKQLGTEIGIEDLAIRAVDFWRRELGL